MTLNLTNNVLNTYLGWHAQVLHDLHESVPFLYDNTVGDGPYNAWIDPTLADEWAELGWNNVAQMQSLGMPGVFTHGDFDTWSPGYLMFLAGMHNGISRLYETFGNGGADTVKPPAARGVFAHVVPAEPSAADGDGPSATTIIMKRVLVNAGVFRRNSYFVSGFTPRVSARCRNHRSMGQRPTCCPPMPLS